MLVAIVIVLYMLVINPSHALQPVRTSSLTSVTSTETILADIRNAFKMVINNTAEVNSLIPKMYRPAMQQRSSVFRFAIPNKKDRKGYSMWSMQRNELVDPIFPNVTLSHMHALVKKQQRPISTQPTPANSIDSGKAEVISLLSHERHKPQKHQEADTWSSLGLEGWSGDIASIVAMNKKPSTEYPAEDILSDFEFEEAKYQSTTEFSGTGQLQHNDTESVYIARVNDPFGSSVKWERRNSTSMDERPKRDIITLYSMIQCSTGCQPLIYKAYGCYCGFLGAGVPVDGIDRCCKVHDKCYEQSNCVSYLQYFVPYVWKCYRGKPLCAIDHGEFGGPDSCAARLCYCDLALSRCLRRFICPQRRAVCRSSRVRRLQNFLLAFK